MMGDRQTGQIQNQGTLGQSHAQGQTSPRQMGQDYRPPYRGGYFGYESINFYYPAAQQERKLPSVSVLVHLSRSFVSHPPPSRLTDQQNNHTRNSRPFGSPTTTSSSTNHHNTTHYGLGLSQNPRLAAQFQNYSGSLYNAGLGFRRRSEHDALGALGMARTGLTGLGGQKIERSQTLENFRANRMSHRWEVQVSVGSFRPLDADLYLEMLGHNRSSQPVQSCTTVYLTTRMLMIYKGRHRAYCRILRRPTWIPLHPTKARNFQPRRSSADL